MKKTLLTALVFAAGITVPAFAQDAGMPRLMTDAELGSVVAGTDLEIDFMTNPITGMHLFEVDDWFEYDTDYDVVAGNAEVYNLAIPRPRDQGMCNGSTGLGGFNC